MHCTSSTEASGLSAELVEGVEREIGEAAHNQFGARQLVRGIAVRNADAAKAGAARRLESPPRILDGYTAAAIERTPSHLLKLPKRQIVRRRRRLALGRIARGDDDREQWSKPGRGEDFIDLMTKRTGGDGDWNVGGGMANEVASTWKQRVASTRQVVKVDPLAGHKVAHLAAGERGAVVLSQRLEHPHIVEAQILVEVVGGAQLEANLAERSLKRSQMKWLAVGDDAIEVEDDRLQRRHETGTFSPALIGTFSRFPGGG